MLGFGGRAPRFIYVEASGSWALAGLRARGGPRALSGRHLIVLCRASPRAEASAQARHEARAGLARARLIPCRAGPKNQAMGQPTGLRADGKL